jgi:two-component system response regulator RegX3
MDSSRRETWVRGEKVDLSRKEFDLLWLMATNNGRVVTRDTCIDTLWWGQDLLDTRTLDTHIKRLRRKIEFDPAEPVHLVTIRGVGFRFDA